MTFAEREQIAAATENCRKLAEAVAALTTRIQQIEDAITMPHPLPSAQNDAIRKRMGALRNA